jgi:hypothetical protein
MPLWDCLKMHSILPKLPALKKRIDDLEKMLKELRSGKPEQ